MLQYALNPKKIIEVVLLWLLHITPRFFWICQNPYGNEGHFNIFFTNEKKSLSGLGIYFSANWLKLVYIIKKDVGRACGGFR